MELWKTEVLYNYDQLFKHLVILGQKKIKTNQKNQKKNILGEQFFWLWRVTEELVIIVQYMDDKESDEFLVASQFSCTILALTKV
jgi:hypothetical protein